MHLAGDHSRLAYVQILDGDRTVAIVPAVRGESNDPCMGRLRVLGPVRHEHVELFDFPVAPDVRAEDVAAALESTLRRLPEHWDALHWPRMLGSSHAMRVARALDPARTQTTPRDPCNKINTQRPFAELLAELSKNLRATLRKSQKRLDADGGLQILRNSVPASLERADLTPLQASYEAFLALEASGWKGQAGTNSAIGLNPATRAFYAELLGLRCADFVPEVALLAHGSVPVAAQFSLTVNGCKHVLKIGYDESHARYSPGQVLMSAVLESSSGGALQSVSLVTNMTWHQAWRPFSEPAYAAVSFRRRWRASRYRACMAMRRIGRFVLSGFGHLEARRGAPPDASTPSPAP